MPPAMATAVCIVGILGLFMLDRDKNVRTSKALWIPVVWLLINGSRPVSQWLAVFGMGREASPLDPVDYYLEGSPIDRNVYIFLLVAGLIALAGRRRQVASFLRANAPIVVFLLYCAASILWSDFPFVAFKRWTKGVGDIVMVLIVLTDSDARAALKQVLKRNAFVLMPLSVLFIKYYPNLGRSYNQWTWTPAFSGVTTNKNTLGMVCLVFGLGCLWCFLAAYRDREDTRRTKRLIAHGTMLAMTLWLFWIANSMTSLSCFALGGGLMVAAGSGVFARKPKLVHLFTAVLVFGSVFALFLDPGGNLIGGLGRDSTLTGRTDIWNLVLGLTGNPLVGTGYESFWLGDRLHKVWDVFKGIQEAHNGYLEVYLNLGYIGVALLGVLIVTGYRNALTVLRRDPDAGRIKLAYFAVGLIYSLTEAGFRMLAPVWFSFLLAIAAIPTPAPAESSPGLDRANSFAQRESKVGQLMGAGLRKETL